MWCICKINSLSLSKDFFLFLVHEDVYDFEFGGNKVLLILSIFQVDRLDNEGYYGGVRLLMAVCKVFHNYCKDNKIGLQGGNFTLSYDTNIPRQVKLSANEIASCIDILSEMC